MASFEIDYNTYHDAIAQPFKRQVKFALSHAINKVLPKARKVIQQGMEKDLDKADRWTKSSIQYKKSTKSNLHGILYYRDDYTALLQTGGTKKPHHGNRKLLEADPTNPRGLTRAKRMKKNLMAEAGFAKKYFFIGKPNAKQGYGLYERIKFAKGKARTAKGNKRRQDRKPRSQSYRLLVSLKDTQRHQPLKLNSRDDSFDYISERLPRQIPVSMRYAIKGGKQRILREFFKTFSER